MENKCKIIQDLLPTYIENMTSDETKNFVEEHLKNCDECKQVFNSMKESLENETIEETEIVREIKKYRKKIKLIHGTVLLILIALILGFACYFIGNFIYKFYVIKMAYERNTNYKNFESFTIEEYADNVEHYEKHYTTYYKNDIMKKYYGDDPIEYYDGENHYFFDNENMTYWIKKEKVNTTLNIDISVLDGTENIIDENKINNFEILKFILFQDNLQVIKSDFREKPYHLVICNDEKIYFDYDTFYAERIVEEIDPEKYDEPTEYRIRTANVGWREIQIPDLSKYTLIEK